VGRPGQDGVRPAFARQQPALIGDGGVVGGSALMKVSAKAEYACLALLALARQRPDAPPLRIREISETYRIPERYLVPILLRLKAAGLGDGRGGAAGGSPLARLASPISAGQAPAAIDGPDDEPAGTASSRRPAAAVLEPVWERVRAAERAILDSTTLAQ